MLSVLYDKSRSSLSSPLFGVLDFTSIVQNADMLIRVSKGTIDNVSEDDNEPSPVGACHLR